PLVDPLDLPVLSYALRMLFFTSTATHAIYTLSLHDALPIWPLRKTHTEEGGHGEGPRRRLGLRHGRVVRQRRAAARTVRGRPSRSEEHTSELQSRSDLVCRLLLEKKNLTASCALSS